MPPKANEKALGRIAEKHQSAVLMEEHTLESILNGDVFQKTPTLDVGNEVSNEDLLAKIAMHVHQLGQPLVISGWNRRSNWKDKAFSLEGFKEALRLEERGESGRGLI